jgi:hypothetical protein
MHTDKSFTPQQFVGLFDNEGADAQVRQMFDSKFGSSSSSSSSIEDSI